MYGGALSARPAAPDLAVFDRRLDAVSDRAIAVALSGGADSLLALRLTLAWAGVHGRRVAALIVDHGLRPQSPAWAAFAAGLARDLGAQAKVLVWRGPYPAHGLPAAARAARHRLLAEAAREAGAGVIVTGHTASDAAENAALGQGALAEWSPSPAWPQGRGVFLLRPLLALSRQAVRERLAREGARWIDDPANEDERHPRVRARRGMAAPLPIPSREPAPVALAAQARFEAGAIAFDRDALRAAAPADRRRVVAAALVCAGGMAKLPRARAVERICQALAAGEPMTASLSGARVLADARRVEFVRNAGDARRGGLAPLRLASGETAVWDGRYALTGPAGITLLQGQAARLPAEERRALKAWPAAARPALPLILCQDGAATCPILATDPAVKARWLVPARFAGACGLIAREGQL